MSSSASVVLSPPDEAIASSLQLGSSSSEHEQDTNATRPSRQCGEPYDARSLVKLLAPSRGSA